jgi:BirA family biotin operon repressor/biotin-[acetyl-CoA-carboxylase] ligase
MQSETVEDFTVVMANHQKYGRGQMGSKWTSEPGKNLIMSVLKLFDDFRAKDQFSLVVCVSLAVVDALKGFEIPNLSIKWPNDIMSGNLKIGGILIENSVKGPKIQSAVIGIGLNVNQTEFVDLPNASSMKLCSGRDFEVSEVLEAVLENLKQGFKTYEKYGPSAQWNLYEEHLFGKGLENTFLIDGDQRLLGKIKGVSAEGKLQITLANGALGTFGLKEIRLLL